MPTIRKISNKAETNEAMVIYLSAFPIVERQPISLILDRLDSACEELFGYFSDESQLIGIAIICNLEYENFLLLDYFAIDENYRGKGHGEIFLDLLINHSTMINKIFIIEIENPYNLPDESPEQKRLKFYRKFNCTEFQEFNYYMPSLNAHEANTIDMKLLSISKLSQTVSEDSLEILKSIIHRKVYGLVPNI